MTEVQAQPQPLLQAPQVTPRKIGIPLGLGIFFMPYVFSWLTLRAGHTGTQKIVSFAWMGVALLLIVTSLSSENRPNSASRATASLASVHREAPAPEEAPTDQVRWMTDSCSDVSRRWGVGSDLTELQKKALWEKDQVAGMHFKWPLKVVSVDSTFSQLQAQFKCQGSNAFVSDVILRLEDEDVALQLVKNKTYTIHGSLKDWGNLIGVSGELIEVAEK